MGSRTPPWRAWLPARPPPSPRRGRGLPAPRARAPPPAAAAGASAPRSRAEPRASDAGRAAPLPIWTLRGRLAAWRARSRYSSACMEAKAAKSGGHFEDEGVALQPRLCARAAAATRDGRDWPSATMSARRPRHAGAAGAGARRRAGAGGRRRARAGAAVVPDGRTGGRRRGTGPAPDASRSTRSTSSAKGSEPPHLHQLAAGPARASRAGPGRSAGPSPPGSALEDAEQVLLRERLGQRPQPLALLGDDRRRAARCPAGASFSSRSSRKWRSSSRAKLR